MRKFVCLVCLLLLLPLYTIAQNALPQDSAVRIGTLENGFTYYIQHNKLPEGLVDVHFVQNVGAVLEEDSQNGLAHFLEHMAFNDTKHFPDKSMTHYLEMNGITYGGNLNAYTSFDETV